MDNERIPLADAIRALRTELLEAMSVGSESELRFGVSGVDLEFEVEASRTGEAEAGVKFWVVNVGAKGSLSTGSTQRVKLSLVPVLASGGEVQVTSFVTGEIG
jgi:hypothetical protein